MPPDRLNLKPYAYKPLGSECTLKTKVNTQEGSNPVLLWARGVEANDVYYPSADERAGFKLKNGKVRL